MIGSFINHAALILTCVARSDCYARVGIARMTSTRAGCRELGAMKPRVSRGGGYPEIVRVTSHEQTGLAADHFVLRRRPYASGPIGRDQQTRLAHGVD
jgi:hypothetical protein